VLQPKVLDLNSLVIHMAEWLPPALGEDIRLRLDLDPTLGRVKADASQIEQVIMNLVFNARDAMPHGGELAILTANTHLDESWAHGDSEVKPGPHVMLTVRDTGLGMDSETQLHIFEPFFSTKQQGTGMGLAICRSIVEAHDGRIWAENLSPVGARFNFTLGTKA
jgi:signal transduction histidine kinase